MSLTRMMVLMTMLFLTWLIVALHMAYTRQLPGSDAQLVRADLQLCIPLRPGVPQPLVKGRGAPLYPRVKDIT